VLDRTQAVAGFFGASSVERLPTERAITAQVREFKGIARGSNDEVGARV
jgi:predicted TIM-barrel enzyme